MHAAGAGDGGMLRKLTLPAIGDTALTKLAGFTGERGRKAAPVVLELVGMVRIGRNVVAEGTSIVGRSARQDTTVDLLGPVSR